MAVAKMKKLSVVALQKDTHRLIADLQKLRCVEVSGDAPACLESEPTCSAPADVSQEMGVLLTQMTIPIRYLAQIRGQITADIPMLWWTGI